MPEEEKQAASVFVENMPDRLTFFQENELLPFLLQAYNRGDSPTVLLTEDDGTLRTWALQVYIDADGNERVGLVDTESVPWVHQYENYQIVDPVALTNAEADLFAPGGGAAELYAVEYNIVNINNAAAYAILTSIGHAVGGGALAQSEMFARDDSIPIRGSTGFQGPHIIRGNDVIRGQAAANNTLTVHFRVRRVDIGA